MSTTSPLRRLNKVDEKFQPAIITGNDEANPDTKSGSGGKDGEKPKKKRGKRSMKKMLHRGHSQQKPGHKKKKTKGEIMDSIVNTVRYILENHGKNVKKVMANCDDKEMLSKMAKKCMATCLSGWEVSGNNLVSENTDLVLSKNSWQIAEDGTALLEGGFKFDYDWLYSLSNADLIKEDVDMNETELDVDSFSDTLSNASNLLRKLSDKEVKKYILNAAKTDEDVDLVNLKEILEDTGVNWKFIGAEIDDEKINLLIRVRYTKDGTQEGVVEKKLSIEVKPTADVTDATGEVAQGDDNEVNLTFSPEEASEEVPVETPEAPETEEAPGLELPTRKSEIEDPEAGLDLGVDL